MSGKEIMNKHTEIPWRVARGSVVADDDTGWDDAENCEFYGGHLVCESVRWPANAEFIVRACNSHEDLLEACKAFVDYYEQAGIGDCQEGHDDESGDGFNGDERFNVRVARAALDKAEGRKP